MNFFSIIFAVVSNCTLLLSGKVSVLSRNVVSRLGFVNLNDIWFSFNVREDLLGDLKMGKIFNVKIPALNNKTVTVKVDYIKALASYATWKATKTTGQFDLKTFEVKASPVEKVENLRPGMSVIIDK